MISHRRIPIFFFCILLCLDYGTFAQVPNEFSSPSQALILKKIIGGNIRPKSIVYSGKGHFWAQNIMYRHSVTVYNRDFQLVKTIKDQVKLSDFHFQKYKGEQQGSPVEAAFTHDGQYAWVSNYQMYGPGFNNPGTDNCPASSSYDPGFLYKIHSETFEIEDVVKVGCVPKYVAVSPGDRWVVVSNWCSGDVSIVDAQKNREIKRIYLGRYPRGIAIDHKGLYAYIALMGTSRIAKIDLKDFSLTWIENIGNKPRHLCIGPRGEFLYVSLNHDREVAKIDLLDEKVIAKVQTGKAPRSMVLSPEGIFLYVVNYFSNTVSKIRTIDMKIMAVRGTKEKPIGISCDPETGRVWVACYFGKIMVFEDLAMARMLKDKRSLVKAPFPQKIPELPYQQYMNFPFTGSITKPSNDQIAQNK